MCTKSICRLTKQKPREALLFRSLSESITFRLFVYIVVSLFGFTILFYFKIKRHFGPVHENFQEKYNNVHPDQKSRFFFLFKGYIHSNKIKNDQIQYGNAFVSVTCIKCATTLCAPNFLFPGVRLKLALFSLVLLLRSNLLEIFHFDTDHKDKGWQ